MSKLAKTFLWYLHLASKQNFPEDTSSEHLKEQATDTFR